MLGNNGYGDPVSIDTIENDEVAVYNSFTVLKNHGGCNTALCDYASLFTCNEGL